MEIKFQSDNILEGPRAAVISAAVKCGFIFILLLNFLSAAPRNISLQTIPTLEQLPVNAIHRIFQDSEGYIWYGTVNGLCRDDGYRIHVFRSDINTPGLLDNNLVQCIAEDKDGKIWFGSDKGAYILDKSDYSVSRLDPQRLKGKFIHKINATSDGSVWVSIFGRILKYDASGALLKEYAVRNGDAETFVGGFCETRKGEIIVTFFNGLIYRLDTIADGFIPFPAEGLRRLNPNYIFEDEKSDYFWVPMWNDGIMRFDPGADAAEDSMYVYQPPPVNAKGEESGIVFYLAQDDDPGYLWCTTSHNLTAFEIDRSSDMLRQVDISSLLPPANRMLNDIIKDRYGNLWVAAFDQPSFIIRFIRDMPINYSLPGIRKRVNGNPAVMSLVDAGDGIFWISQERTGIFLYDLGSDRESCYTDFSSTKQLPLHTVKQMCSTGIVPNGAWISPENSLNVYLLGRKGMTMELCAQVDLGAHIRSGSVRTVYEDSNRLLWIGLSNGLYLYDRGKDLLRTISDTLGFVSGVAESPGGIIWVCTANNGLHRISPEGKIESYPFAHSFSSVTIASDGVVWLGSEEGGVYSFHPQTGLQDFSKACDMNGDQVNRLIADMFNHIWIDTNRKLIEFNPRNGSFYNYLTTDETILLRRLIPTSACLGKDKNIYFGGIPGMLSVAPSNRLDSEARAAKAIVTNVKVSGKSLIFGGSNPGNSLSSIRLFHNDRNIEIEFSSLNHCVARKIRYAYKLTGIDNDWTHIPTGQNTALYSRLPQGRYTFEVKATDENGVWSNETSTLAIHRLPAFYETWWAGIIYVALASGILIYGILIYIRRRERKNKELWSDSEEMVKMRRYLKAEVNPSDLEYAQLDKLLLDKATRIVESNISEPDFGVSEMARSMNMSHSTLTRKLKTITGLTPFNFIRNIKMQHACRLLQDTDLNVSEVASTLGYFNRKHFSICFKEEFGMTPSEYKKRDGEQKKDASGENLNGE